MKFFSDFKLYLLTILCLTSIFPNAAIACSCGGFVSNFCSYNHPTAHVALVTITDSIDYFLKEAKVIENINQEIETEFINVFGQDGLNCAQNLDEFAIGDTLIFALSEAFTTNFGDNTHVLGGCGLTYLHYSNNQVTGHIHGTLETQDYDEFLENMDGCLLGVNIDEPTENSIKIYPTFTSNEITLETGSNSMDVVAIYSSNGQLMQQLEENLSNQKILDVKDLQKGVYFVQVNIGGEVFTEKVVKM